MLGDGEVPLRFSAFTISHVGKTAAFFRHVAVVIQQTAFLIERARQPRILSLCPLARSSAYRTRLGGDTIDVVRSQSADSIWLAIVRVQINCISRA